MSRKVKRRNPIPTFAFVVDGETEIWYLQMLKQNERGIRLNVKPKIPQKKALEDQFDLVCVLAKGEYDSVYWIVDLDAIIKESNEAISGTKTRLSCFNEMRVKLCNEYQNVRVIVNNPCLEFWFLLHFERTSKYYRSCSYVVRSLKKYLSGYEKTERFFKKRDNDIYLQLKPFLHRAIENAAALDPFDLEDPERAICEMHELFHHKEFKPCLGD
ncbi:MAG: RloB family protein [Parabacteroides sp.]|nr:RloB family protein [Parabacteroides sp.]